MPFHFPSLPHRSKNPVVELEAVLLSQLMDQEPVQGSEDMHSVNTHGLFSVSSSSDHITCAAVSRTSH
ncbi:hypothetical protein E2C01_041724 [Portunus trituberculatus]|uniref:Uncharacterized protein n=1 Tax=Portunus trituberculatus TaxID=210409 RepID=A0A5B7FSG6_PORTR|nr:hypothetical protein [Portunus trituberculatus]